MEVTSAAGVKISSPLVSKRLRIRAESDVKVWLSTEVSPPELPASQPLSSGYAALLLLSTGAARINKK